MARTTRATRSITSAKSNCALASRTPSDFECAICDSRRAERITAKAREKGHVQVLEKLTEQVDGEHRIIEEVPLIVRETHLENGTPINEALGHRPIN